MYHMPFYSIWLSFHKTVLNCCCLINQFHFINPFISFSFILIWMTLSAVVLTNSKHFYSWTTTFQASVKACIAEILLRLLLLDPIGGTYSAPHKPQAVERTTYGRSKLAALVGARYACFISLNWKSLAFPFPKVGNYALGMYRKGPSIKHDHLEIRLIL